MIIYDFYHLSEEIDVPIEPYLLLAADCRLSLDMKAV